MRRRQIIIIVATILLGTLLFLMIRALENRQYSWVEDYRIDNRGPYGTSVVKTLLEDYLPGARLRVMEDSLRAMARYQKPEKANYIFIGASQFLDSADLETLLQFVEAGNTALIASRSLSEELAEYLYYYDCYDTAWDGYDFIRDTSIRLNLEHPNFTFGTAPTRLHTYRGSVVNYRWQYLSRAYICDDPEGFTELGTFNENFPNFVRIPAGEGFFYLHTNPMLFTNIQLLDRDHLSYIEGVLSHLQAGTIFWDEHSKLSGYRPRRDAGNRGLLERTPLEYILSQPPLAWAWYLLLLTGLLYLLFRSKRRQRIIPVLPRNRNTSLEFIQTIGHLYFLQKNHKKLARQKGNLFMSFIREHYGLQTRDLDEQFEAQLAARAEVPAEQVAEILLLYRNIQSSSFVSEKILLSFHQKIEAFYKICK